MLFDSHALFDPHQRRPLKSRLLFFRAAKSMQQQMAMFSGERLGDSKADALEQSSHQGTTSLWWLCHSLRPSDVCMRARNSVFNTLP